MILRDERRVQFGQNWYFLDNILDIVFGILDVNHLDSDGLASALIDAVNQSLVAFERCGTFFMYPLYTFPKLPPPVVHTLANYSIYALRKPLTDAMLPCIQKLRVNAAILIVYRGIGHIRIIRKSVEPFNERETPW